MLSKQIAQTHRLRCIVALSEKRAAALLDVAWKQWRRDKTSQTCTQCAGIRHNNSLAMLPFLPAGSVLSETAPKPSANVVRRTSRPQ